MADLFSDGFESGDLTAWDSSATDSGDLSAHADAALHGSYGLKCVIDDTTAIYVRDDTPNNEKRYRFRFYLDVNSITFNTSGNDIYLVVPKSSGDDTVLRVILRYTSSAYKIFVQDRTDGTYAKATSLYTITDEPHYIEVDWKASSGAGNNDGTLELLIDGVSKETVSSIDSDLMSVATTYFGAYTVQSNISGTFYLDDFASNNDGSLIGSFSSPSASESASISSSPSASESASPSASESASISSSPSASESASPSASESASPSSSPSSSVSSSPSASPSPTWSGLGMNINVDDTDIEVVEAHLTMLINNGFEYLRMEIPDYQNSWMVSQTKLIATTAIELGAKVVWGVSSNSYNNVNYTITAANWSTFADAVLAAAAWAEANGIYEFALGNEEEYHVDGTTLTAAQLRTNMKALATDVQAVYTIGNVSYTTGTYDAVTLWDDIGLGDIDIIGMNVYRGDTTFNDDWKWWVDNLVINHGADHCGIYEFNLSMSSLDNYSTDEAVQASALAEMIAYIENSGVTRAYYFKDISDNFGFIKADRTTYRLLWGELMSGVPSTSISSSPSASISSSPSASESASISSSPSASISSSPSASESASISSSPSASESASISSSPSASISSSPSSSESASISSSPSASESASISSSPSSSPSASISSSISSSPSASESASESASISSSPSSSISSSPSASESASVSSSISSSPSASESASISSSPSASVSSSPSSSPSASVSSSPSASESASPSWAADEIDIETWTADTQDTEIWTIDTVDTEIWIVN